MYWHERHAPALDSNPGETALLLFIGNFMRFATFVLVTVLCLFWTAVASSQTTQPSGTNQAGGQQMNQLLAIPPASGQPLPAAAGGPAIDSTTGKAAIAPNAPVLRVVREGTHLVNHSGRLSHSADGKEAIFTFDTDGTTMGDPPMIILPNLKLQSMEAVEIGKAADAHFRISGTVTEYKGRNYILLDKAVVMADVEQQF